MLEPITIQEVIDAAPSVAADSPDPRVSARYSFIPTIAVVEALCDAGWFPVMAGQSVPRKKEREALVKHMVRFQREDLDVANGAECVDLLLYNSHDRTTAFQLTAGVYRFVCSNGLVIGDDIASHAVKHINTAPDQAAAASVKIADMAPRIAGQIEDFKTIELKPDEKGVFALAAHNLLFDDPEAAPFPPDRLLQPKRTQDDNATLWGAYNVMQENIIKGGVPGEKTDRNGKHRRSKSRPVKAIDRNIKLNKAHWLLTEKMAELKS